MMQEHSRFQLEATKLARTVVFQVTVFSRGDKARPRLYAETQCSENLRANYPIPLRFRDGSTYQFCGTTFA